MSLLENIDMGNVGDYHGAISYISKYHLPAKFKTLLEIPLDISTLGISGNYRFYDLSLDKMTDVYRNFAFENVDHYAFLSKDDTDFNHFPEEILVTILLWMFVKIRVYFPVDNTPKSFKVSYESVLLPKVMRLNLCYNTYNVYSTRYHDYKDGYITEK